jgi:hypothetical protein
VGGDEWGEGEQVINLSIFFGVELEIDEIKLFVIGTYGAGGEDSIDWWVSYL